MRLDTLFPTPRGVLCFAVLGIAASAVGPLASAAIGINFGSTTPLGVSETAGVVAKGYWNNAAGPGSASPLKLVDDTGAATNVAVTWKADGVWNTPVADTQGNNRLMRGYLDTNTLPTSVNLTGLTSGTYNIYVYVDGDNSSVARSATYQISGQGVTTAAISLTDSPNATFSGTFIQANSGSGNYVLFSNITIASGATLTATPALKQGKDSFGNNTCQAVLGVSRSMAPGDIKTEHVDPLSAVWLGEKALLTVGGDYRQPALEGVLASLSHDGGAHWSPISAAPGFLSSVVRGPGQEAAIVAVGLAGTGVSNDFGKTWRAVDEAPYNTAGFAVSGASKAAAGWAVGPKGVIARWR